MSHEKKNESGFTNRLHKLTGVRPSWQFLNPGNNKNGWVLNPGIFPDSDDPEWRGS